jgi:hypothetical protein
VAVEEELPGEEGPVQRAPAEDVIGGRAHDVDYPRRGSRGAALRAL